MHIVLHLGRTRPRACLVFCLALVASGCGKASDVRRDEKRAAMAQEQRTTETAPAVPIGGNVDRVDLTLFDPAGAVVARIKARTGAVGQTGGKGSSGVLRDGVATLWENGEPAAVLSANRIVADQATRSVTGEGNAVLRSHVHPGSPTVRADTMRWRHNDNTVRGAGNVVLTQSPNVHVRGKAFVADIRLQRVRIQHTGAATARAL